MTYENEDDDNDNEVCNWGGVKEEEMPKGKSVRDL
jgi:hypothetical protein